MPTPLLLTSIENLQAIIERTVKASEGRVVAAVLQQLRDQEGRTMIGLEGIKAAQVAAQKAVESIALSLGSIGTSVAEIGSDLTTLIQKLAEGQPGSEEVAEATTQAEALVARLNAVAAMATDQATAAKAAADQFTPSAESAAEGSN